MNLLVAVHRSLLLIVFIVVLFPVLIELIFLHVDFLFQIQELFLILQLHNLVLGVDAVLSILIFFIFFPREQHKSARQELVPNLQHLVGGKDLSSFLHLVFSIECNQLSDGIGLVLFCTLLIIVEERGCTSNFLPLDDLLVLVRLDFDDEKVLAAHSLLVHLARIGLQHVVQVPSVEAPVEFLCLTLFFLLIIATLLVLISIIVVLLLCSVALILPLDFFHLGNGVFVVFLLS